MTAYTIVNTTSAELTDVNAGGYDIPPLSICEDITLDTTELAAAVALPGVAVILDDLNRTQTRVLARGLKYLPKRVAGTG